MNPDLRYVLDLLAGGHFPAALASLQTLLRQFPKDVNVLNLHGIASAKAGRPDEAVKCFQKAIKLRPVHAQSHNNLGMLYLELGRAKEAELAFRRAAALDPSYEDAFFNLGMAQFGLGKLDAAQDAYESALKLNPVSCRSLINLGVVHEARTEWAAAIACYERATSLQPDDAIAWVHLGNAHRASGEFAPAETAYRTALSLAPALPGALQNLSACLIETRRYQEAVDLLEPLKTSGRVSSELLANLALAYIHLGHFEQARQLLANAMSADPDNPSLLRNMALLHQEQGDYPQAVTWLRKLLERKPQDASVLSQLLFAYNYLPDVSVQSDLSSLASRYGRTLASAARVAPMRQHQTHGLPLRVGFVSGDFCDHSVGYFMEDWIRELSRSEIQCVAFRTSVKHTALSDRIRASFDGWHSVVGMTDAALADLISENRIDILIDLSGHSDFNRLSMFAMKPAPIQMSWLGYCATSGLAEMDYYLADEASLPLSSSDAFVEKILRFPQSYVCFSTPKEDVTVAASPCLANGYVTFGSFNNLGKMNDEVVVLWAEVLRQVPASRLLLKSPQLKSEYVRQRVTERYRDQGIAADRLILNGPVQDRAEHLAAYNMIDIAVDPFPYNGVTTTCEALWMGVPVLVMAGDTMLSRQGQGLLSNVGLRQWIAGDREEFVQNAQRLAAECASADEQKRMALRKTLQKSPVMDATGFARHFESLMKQAWRERFGALD